MIMLAVCWEMGPSKVETLKREEAAGKTGKGQVQSEGVCLLLFGLACLSLDSVTSRGC